MAKQKSTEALTGTTAYRKNFVKLLNKFNAYGYSRWNVFTDFLQMSAISLANCDRYCLANSKATVDEREEQYKRTIGKYKPEVQNLFAEMFAQIVLEAESYCPNQLTDVLGELFHELNFQDKWKAQCFTPQSVCDMTGMMTLEANTAKSAIEAKGFLTVNEPCCGGGAMLLGAANAMSKLGLNPQKQMLIVANDIDERCVHMCFIQLSLYGLARDSLSAEHVDARTFRCTVVHARIRLRRLDAQSPTCI